jgi:phage terminase small subunit
MLNLSLTVDVEKAGRAAYEQFTGHNVAPKPWEQLPEGAKDSWRRIAQTVLEYVTTTVTAS